MFLPKISALSHSLYAGKSSLRGGFFELSTFCSLSKVQFSPRSRTHLPVFLKGASSHSKISTNPLSVRAFSATPLAQMSSKVVEHTVLFKIREGTEPEKVDAMMSGLRGLTSLDSVIYLTTGRISKIESPSFTFTHVLHSRYHDKDGLAQYAGDPKHVAVLKELILPISEDILALDWVADVEGPLFPTWDAFRLSILKPREGLSDEERGEVQNILGYCKKFFPSIKQLSFGENFTPARAKGFSWGVLSFFNGLKELKELDENEEYLKLQKEKVRAQMEDYVVIDYELVSQADSP
ncbi:hypothetical protein AMTRI_Chr04g243130 [Amborella trichopoda]|uniref:Stress-response A/B barrel domain-containing protein n=1 Tax=Amborella trichopoda TaxID=13333 RepID=U5DBB7_AMBTC|nr:stress-response A/B barrel domain-containing protein UP3 [Amborella trichopoda]ERN18717.1 hypothetical protein AMTR_s00322p00016350 [Amborella trichopoda]|eukprot:XP_006857250.1 stress-response A/B barrel domain-containing protein UP3 [Amborella trichopoda]